MTDRNYEIVDTFREFYRDYYRDDIGELVDKFPKDQQSLYVDARDVFRFSPDLLDDWVANYQVVTDAAEAALAEFDIPVSVDLSDANVRLTDPDDYLDAVTVAGLSNDDIGEFVAVSGQMSRVTDKSPRVRRVVWRCTKCQAMTEFMTTRTEVPDPHECKGCETQGPFRVDEKQSEWTDQRKIKLEEPIEERSKARGESVPVFVEDDLVDYGPGETTLPEYAGKKATVIGVVNIDESELSGRSGSPETDLWIDATAIVFDTDGESDIDIDAHRDEFEDHAAADDAIDRVAESLAPSLQAGPDDDLYTVRRAVAAWLFNAYRMDPEDAGSKRGDIHMGIIGDPGTGKSTLMSYVDDILPNSEYRSGTGLSEAGLTSAAVQEEFAGETEWTLQPGILPRADGGHCIIDEIDGAVDSDTKAMHDALEGDQMVKADKAGIKADLPSRCALLAGGNPTYTRFQKMEPIAQQIDLDPALIDRLDLLFALQDEVNEARDEKKADHALDAYDALAEAEVAQRTDQHTDEDGTVTDPPVSKACLRAWIAHARQEVFPTLTDDVKESLKSFYVEARNLNGGHEGADDAAVPVGMRTLEASARLSIAFARLRLSETVEQCDVDHAVDLVRDVVGMNYDPESGEFDSLKNTRGEYEQIKPDIIGALNRDGPLLADELSRMISLEEERVREALDHYKTRGDVIERKGKYEAK